MRTLPEILLPGSMEFEIMFASTIAFWSRRVRHLAFAGAATAAFALLATVIAAPSLAGTSSQPTFASPEQASRALVSAVLAQDEWMMRQILGSGRTLISGKGAAEDALERQYFIQKYREMHRWVRESNGLTTLLVGAENWPFPIPLMSDGEAWRFNSTVGSQEILFRRIGENEVLAIGVCNTLLTGKASVVKALKPILYHGYYFHTLLNSARGLAAIAYPARYRSSGVMTFIVTQGGDLSEKDLGPKTAKIARRMDRYQPDATWTAVDPEAP
jgi:hypothetical protein